MRHCWTSTTAPRAWVIGRRASWRWCSCTAASRPHTGSFATDKVQDGLGELFLLGRLDLTVEHHVLLPEYAPLFSADERRSARQRLGIPDPPGGAS